MSAEGSSRRPPVLNVVLFLATAVTTTIAGAFNAGVAPTRIVDEWHRGLPFSATLLAILLSHEMGHYLQALRHRVPATLPYFLPGPPIIVGTFGAFIRMRGSPRSRRALFDVGATGPWAGFVVALPAVVWGLAHSEIVRIPPTFSGLYFGDSLLFAGLSHWIIGPLPPGYDVVLHPVAMAGWLGFFVTALNLLPMGQLDGGHVLYAMWGRWHRWIGTVIVAALVVLGTIGWKGWLIWALFGFLTGLRHPPTLDAVTPLDGRRMAGGWATLALFALVVVPTPIRWAEGGPDAPVSDFEIARADARSLYDSPVPAREANEPEMR